MKTEKNFSDRFFESLKTFERNVSLGSGWVLREDCLEQFLDMGGEWLYDEGYVTSVNREFYRRMISMFLDNDEIKQFSYDDINQQTLKK